MCCEEGGTQQTNITGTCGDCLQCMYHTGFDPAQDCMWFPIYTAHAPGYSAAHCPKWTLTSVHFSGLSCSGSASCILHKGTDLVRCAFCALPRSEQLRRPGAYQAHCPRWAVCLNHLPSPGRLVSWGHHVSTISGLLYVSSGELISALLVDFNHPGSQEDLVSSLGSLLRVWWKMPSLGWDCSSLLPSVRYIENTNIFYQNCDYLKLTLINTN